MKYILVILILAIFQSTIKAQVPQLVNYQGIVRNLSGDAVKDKDIRIRLSILNSGQQSLFSETHNVKTNSLGLFAIKLGSGTVVNGNFATLSWSVGEKLLKVEVDIDGGNNFVLLGQPETIVSVPYALQSKSASEVELNGDVIGLNNSSKVIALNGNAVSGIFPSQGDVLKWNGSQWQPGTDATSGGGSYNAGQGISISGNSITNIGDLSNTNELQQISLNNNTLSLSNNGGSVTLPSGGGSYTAGNGISIAGNQISNSGDLSITNEIQTLSISGNNLSLSNGGGSITLPGSGGNSYWESAGGSDIINNNAGTVFLGGQAVPFQTLWASGNNNSATCVLQQQGSGQALSAEALNGSTAIVASGGDIGLDAKGRVYGVKGINTGPVAGFGVFGETNLQQGIGGSFRNDLGGVGLECLGTFKLLTNAGPGNGYVTTFIGGITGQFAVDINATIHPSDDNFYNLGTPSFKWKTVYSNNGMINTSDAKQKQNIKPLNYGLNQLMKLKPVSFEWKSNPQEGKKLGFLAQDLQEIIPEVVSDKEWIVNSTGSLECKKSELLGVYYSDIIPVITKAIQEQQVMIEELNKYVLLLEEKIKQLENEK